MSGRMSGFDASWADASVISQPRATDAAKNTVSGWRQIAVRTDPIIELVLSDALGGIESVA